MAGPSLVRVIRQLRRLLGPAEGDEPSDTMLLRRCARQREHDAFRAILARHGSLVLRACRQVLANDHDAEDAFQATFLVLASRAASVRRGQALAAWLHR